MTNQSETMRSKPYVIELPSNRHPIRLEGELLPNNDWLISQRSIAKAVGKDEKAVRYQIERLTNEYPGFSIAEQMASKRAVSLDTQALQSPQKVRSGENKRASNCYPILAAVMVWQKFAEGGCIQSAAILAALATEALEIRADRVASVTRTEKERDDRFANNMQRVHQVGVEAGLRKASVRRQISKVYEFIKTNHRELINPDMGMVYLSDFNRHAGSEKLLEALEPVLDIDPYTLIKSTGDGVLIRSENHENKLRRLKKEEGELFNIRSVKVPSKENAFSVRFTL